MKEMVNTEKIVGYLKKAYQPDAVIVYGSFADGSANLNSDFDALIIAEKEKAHDSSIVDGVVPDVFVYPAETFSADYDPEEFVQVWDGKIVLDEHGIAGQLKAKVLDYIEHLPKKTATEVAQEVEWPKKMLRLMEKSDAEAFGLYAKALREFDRESLSAWTDYLKSMVNIRSDGTLTRLKPWTVRENGALSEKLFLRKAV